MDSKETLWIFGGIQNGQGQKLYGYAVWNYNPKTDQYRWVWKPEFSQPRDAGELGVPAETNHPGAFKNGGAAIDKNDNIWFPAYETGGELWMFNTTSWLFVRIFGSTDTTTASTGAVPGMPAEDVWPGRVQGSCILFDSQNDIWLLAGDNSDITNTVWHFNTTSRLWRFIGGDIPVIEDGHTTKFFGGAWGAACDMDDNDRVWLYGGWGYHPSGSGNYANIWTFDTRGNRVWEFENGGDDTFLRKPQVVAADYHPDNHPGASEHSIFVDRRDGTMMLVSGGGTNSDGEWSANDVVWLYSKSLKQWKLVHGSINASQVAGAYTNYREPGSIFPNTCYMGRHNGKNFNGDVYIVGGGVVDSPWWRKDFWIIPQDQCAHNLSSCGANADCVEEMVGYSCACKTGYSGDGRTCTDIPPSSPSPPPESSSSPKATISDASATSGVYGLAVALTLAALLN